MSTEQDTAPRSAYEAAARLADAGEHVHLAAAGESVCYSGHCQEVGQ